MGKFLALFVCLLASPFALSAPKIYEVKMDLTLDGRPVPQQKLTIAEGYKTTFTQDVGTDKIFIEFSAKEGGLDTIGMNFIVGKIDASGQKTILANPQTMAAENSAFQVTQQDPNGKDSFSLNAVAKRVSSF